MPGRVIEVMLGGFRRERWYQRLCAASSGGPSSITKLGELDLTVALISERNVLECLDCLRRKKRDWGLGLGPEWNEELR
jgi:hypothetical protein